MYKAMLIAALIAMPAAAAAQAGQPANVDGSRRAAATCGVTSVDAFERFIATKPTVNEFRTAYSCVTLVLPGDATTTEFRTDKSRYFAQLDAHGRIVGGNFR